MSDIGTSKSVDVHPMENPAITRSAESLGVSPHGVQQLVIKTKKGVEVTIIKGEAKNETAELNEAFKQGFIQKLKQLPDYEGSKVKEAIEKGTIEIKKIPDRKGYAIYERKTGNLVYLTYLDGRKYLNVDRFRYVDMLSDIVKAGYIRQGYGKIELDTKTQLWKLYTKDNKEVPIFSDEYATATLDAVNVMLDFSDYIIDEAEKKGLKKKD